MPIVPRQLVISPASGLSGGGGVDSRYMNFTVDTSIAGSSGVGNFTFPVLGTGINYDIYYDGASSPRTGLTESVTLDDFNGAPGIKEIQVRGTPKRLNVNDTDDPDKWLSILSWGSDVAWGSNIASFLRGCRNLTFIASDYIADSAISIYNSPFRDTAIPKPIAFPNSDGATIPSCFRDCSSIVSVLNGDYELMKTLGGASQGFRNIPVLTRWEQEFFQNTVASDFLNCWNSCAFDQASVDFILNQHVLSGVLNGATTLTGASMSPPSAAGLADAATLTGRGWTVQVNS